MRDRARQYVPPDLVPGRGDDEERRINQLFAQVFSGDAGQKVLDYLESRTIRNVAGPEVTDGQLRHLEGQRFLFHVIQMRVIHGRERKPAERNDDD